ncbi:MAG: mechanosensitive ion channel family protein [Deltaproteobacteria bacterium]
MLSDFISKIYNPAYAEKLLDWFITSGFRIVIILAGIYILLRVINKVINRLETKIAERNGDMVSALETERRLKTITSLLRHIVFIVLFGIAMVMILKEVGMDIGPIIAGAGILGLAVSFGAQNLVRDIISGFFIILEDQVRVGDIGVINGTAGTVEEINFRTIVIRDLEGTVHVYPNGAINELANKSKGWSRYVIDVGVAYKENVDNVMEVLREIGDELKEDKHFGALTMEPLDILGVDNFGASEIVIKCMIKTHPLKQWEVGRELRRRIKNKFDEKGIEIPFPHLSVYFGEESKPVSLNVENKKGNGETGVETETASNEFSSVGNRHES